MPRHSDEHCQWKQFILSSIRALLNVYDSLFPRIRYLNALHRIDATDKHF